MPTVITHAIVGAAGAGAWNLRKNRLKFIILSLTCPVLPDLDVIGFKLGIKYEDFLGHRGFFHSLFLGCIVGLLVSSVFFREERFFSKAWIRLTLYFSALTATHGLLDAFTSGGLGIALLSPFDDTRYFFPWTPIKVSPINVHRFLNHRGIAILKTEALWIWLPAGVFVVLTWLYRAMRKKSG